MELHNPAALAAELRERALSASDEERADLLFLAAEYDRLAEMIASGKEGIVAIRFPK